MRKRIEKSPVLITILLFFISLIPVAIFALILTPSDFEIGTSIARIIVALIYLALFIRCFNLKNSFRGILLALPALLMGLYQIPLTFLTEGGTINPFSLSILITGLAPGIFEEVLFRGILIHGLRHKYNDPKKIVLISALVFALIHITNIGGMPLISIIIQVLLALAVGTVLGAAYLRTEDIASVILIHAAIDVIGYTFISGETSSLLLIGIFALLLIAEIIYGMCMIPGDGVRVSSKAD